MKYLNNQSKSLRKIHALALGSVIAASMTVPITAEDAYEENDFSNTPPYTGMKLNDPLSAIAGVGEQFDQDWYSLDLPVLGREVKVEIEWLDTPGSENLTAFYVGGPQNGQTIFGDGTLTFTPTGAAKVVVGEVQFGGQGKRYDLRYYYTDEDPYEEPNLSDDRYNAGYRPAKGLSLLNDQGPGKLYDSDDFRLQVPPGEEQLVIDCRFPHTEGDVDILLVKPEGAVALERAESTTDNEQIVYNLPPEGGNYHIIVYSTTAYYGQTYDLSWTTRNPLKMAQLAKCKKLKRKIKVAKRKKQAAKVGRLKRSYRKCLRQLR